MNITRDYSESRWLPVNMAVAESGYSRQYVKRLCQEEIIRCGENMLGILMINMKDLLDYDKAVAVMEEKE